MQIALLCHGGVSGVCVFVAVLQTVPEITQQQKTLGMSKLKYNNFDCLVMGNLWPGGCI